MGKISNDKSSDEQYMRIAIDQARIAEENGNKPIGAAIVVIFVYSALILSTLLVFWQVRNFDFIIYDDGSYVYQNPHVLSGLTRSGVIWAFTSCYLGYWQPLTWLSLMVDCQLFGALPGRIHLVNVFLHIANTLLLFWVLKKMTGSLWSSAFVAAAFAIHPMHVESVAWIAERKDVLSTFFLLLTLAAYTGYTKSPTIYRYMASLVLFAFGLMAKPILVTVPFLLLLLDYWPLERTRGRRTEDGGQRKSSLGWLIVEKIPFLVLSVVSSIITFLTQKAGGIIYDTKTVPLTDRAGNAFLSYARYIGKLFVPKNLAVFYPFDIGSFVFWQVAMCIVLLIVISVLVIRFGRDRKFLPVGWFWFIGMLVPVIGLVTFTGSSYADRFTYIPYIGLFIMLAWGLPELLSEWRYRKIVLGMAASMTLIALGTGAYRQVGVWNNSITLFSHAIEVTHNNALVHNYLGSSYFDLKRYQDAMESCRQAINIMPDYAEAHYNLGNAYCKLGRYQDAAQVYKQAIKIKPGYIEAYNNLGNAYVGLGRFQEAAEAFKQAINIKPDYADAHNNLGNACLSLGRWQDAIENYKQAIRIKPNWAEAHYNLGAAYGKIGSYQDALEIYKRAVRIDPALAEAHNGLGAAYLDLGRYQDALESCRQAIRIKLDYADAYYNLGEAFVGLGRYDEALGSFNQAIKIKPDFAEAHYKIGFVYSKLGRYQEEIESYKQAISIKPDFADAHYNLGVACGVLGRYQESIDSFKRAVSIKPDYADAHYNLGVTYLITADLDSAVQEYEILKTLDTKKADQLYNLINK
jgi:tetratricopeptide (TPR) repeat protein